MWRHNHYPVRVCSESAETEVNLNLRGRAYRTIMRLAHRFNWHYMQPSYPDGDTMLWCHWCGIRIVTEYRLHKKHGWLTSDVEKAYKDLAAAKEKK